MNSGADSSNSSPASFREEAENLKGSENTSLELNGIDSSSSSSSSIHMRSPATTLACNGGNLDNVGGNTSSDGESFPKTHVSPAPPLLSNADICRDYLRNLCKRGDRCKFKHPPKTQDIARSKAENLFCHDYANNRQCARGDIACKFLHALRDEEDYYKTTGDLPPRLAEQARRKGLEPEIRGQIPICKDFLKGTCSRGDKCRFQHQIPLPPDTDGIGGGASSRSPTPPPEIRTVGSHLLRDESAAKRRRTDNNSFMPLLNEVASNIQRYAGIAAPLHFSDAADMPATTGLCCCNASLELRSMRDEGVYLRRRVDELEKKVYTLTAQNDYLTSVHSSAATQAGLNAAVHVAGASSVVNSIVPVVHSTHSATEQHNLLSAAAQFLAATSQQQPSVLTAPVTVSIAPSSLSGSSMLSFHHSNYQQNQHYLSTSPTLHTTFSTSPTPAYSLRGFAPPPPPPSTTTTMSRLANGSTFIQQHQQQPNGASAAQAQAAAAASAVVAAHLTGDPYAAAAVVAAAAQAASSVSPPTLHTLQMPSHLSVSAGGGFVPVGSIVTPVVASVHHLAAAGSAAPPSSIAGVITSVASSTGGVLYHPIVAAASQANTPVVATPASAAAAAAVARALHQHHNQQQQQQQQHAAATAAAVAAVQQVVAAATGTAPPSMT